jgi:hypothetical protein
MSWHPYLHQIKYTLCAYRSWEVWWQGLKFFRKQEGSPRAFRGTVHFMTISLISMLVRANGHIKGGSFMPPQYVFVEGFIDVLVNEAPVIFLVCQNNVHSLE